MFSALLLVQPDLFVQTICPGCNAAVRTGHKPKYAMLIQDEKKLRKIQEEFREKYPYLKIEFYGPNGKEERKLLDPESTIGEVRTIHAEGEVSIHGNVKVKTLEESFSKHYGLNVQVFRLSGNLWLQTTSTDDWTLHEQNRKGGASKSHFEEKYEL